MCWFTKRCRGRQFLLKFASLDPGLLHILAKVIDLFAYTIHSYLPSHHPSMNDLWLTIIQYIVFTRRLLSDQTAATNDCVLCCHRLLFSCRFSSLFCYLPSRMLLIFHMLRAIKAIMSPIQVCWIIYYIITCWPFQTMIAILLDQANRFTKLYFPIEGWGWPPCKSPHACKNAKSSRSRQNLDLRQEKHPHPMKTISLQI